LGRSQANQTNIPPRIRPPQIAKTNDHFVSRQSRLEPDPSRSTDAATRFPDGFFAAGRFLAAGLDLAAGFPLSLLIGAETAARAGQNYGEAMREV
jgi:hypothetical protein